MDNDQTQPVPSDPNNKPKEPVVDQMRLQMLMQQIRDEQNLLMGVMGGAAAALVGAVAWGLVTYFTGWQIGVMSIGVAFIVGWSVRKFGKGVDQVYGIIGASLSLCGSVLGNYFALCMVIADQEGVFFTEILESLDISIAIDLMVQTFTPIDILFYGLALYYGYKYSIRDLTEEETKSIQRA